MKFYLTSDYRKVVDLLKYIGPSWVVHTEKCEYEDTEWCDIYVSKDIKKTALVDGELYQRVDTEAILNPEIATRIADGWKRVEIPSWGTKKRAYFVKSRFVTEYYVDLESAEDLFDFLESNNYSTEIVTYKCCPRRCINIDI